MQILDRTIDRTEILKRIDQFPVTAILGPRKCGKKTLALTLEPDHHFAPENPRDIARLENPQLTLEDLEGLIVIDEIQRIPEVSDSGSASRELIQQRSESLAGRIACYPLGGFRMSVLKT